MTVLAIEDWPGINLAVDLEQEGVRGARDAVDVIVREEGLLETRPGWYNLPTPVLAARPLSVLALDSSQADASTYIVVSCVNASTYVYRRSGTLVASAATGTAYGMARMGTVTADRVYLLGTGGVRWYEGGVFAGPAAGSPTGLLLATWGNQSRLVAGYLSGGGAGANQYSVRFSAAGDGTTWGATDYLDLLPGDGSPVNALVAWREFMFVFKQNKFFVFYGISTDSGGGAVFNYRTVDTGIGTWSSGPGAVVAAPEGVYFVGRDGVYLTSGGPPVRVSGALDPIWRGAASGDTEALLRYGGPVLYPSSLVQPQLAYMGGRLYMSVVGTGNSRATFVYEPDAQRWTRYSFSTADAAYNDEGPGMSVLHNLDRTELVFLDQGNSRLAAFNPLGSAVTDQGGAAINWVYELASYQLDRDGGEAIVRRSCLDANGSAITLKMAVDGLPPTGDGGVVLNATGGQGGAGQWTRAWDTRAWRGRRLAARLSGSGAAAVRRLEHHVSASRQPDRQSVA